MRAHRLIPLIPLLLLIATGQDDCGGSEGTPTPAPITCCHEIDGTLSWDDGQADAVYQWQQTLYTDVYEYVRFEPQAPYCVCAVEAQVAPDFSGEATLYLWDDFGGNRVNFNTSEPLAAMSAVANAPGSTDAWTRFTPDRPLVVDPPLYLYAGMIWGDEGDAHLAMDALSEGQGGGIPSSLVWLSSVPDGPDDAPEIAAASGDFMVRLLVDWINEVSETQFTEVAPETYGIWAARRLALGDYDGDGDDDLMTNGPRLFEAQGDGTFVEVTAAAGLDGLSASGGVWGDYDNDGLLDFFAIGRADILLKNNGDGTFSDVTALSGINDSYAGACNDQGEVEHAPTEGAAWFDLDNDGFLDLYQANYECGDPKRYTLDRLWKNRGDGTFEDITDASGVAAAEGSGLAGRGVTPGDYNSDGLTDIYVSNYRLHRNFLFENQGDGTFLDVAGDVGAAGDPDLYRGDIYYGHTIGSAFGDLDNDGDLDLFAANLAHPRYYAFSDVATLLVNEVSSTGAFREVTEDGGFIYRETPSNPNLFDYDNDGLLDVFYTQVYEGYESQIYHNDGGLNFSQQNYAAGVHVDNGWGSVVGDIDHDGDLDLISRGLYFNNNLSQARHLAVRTLGSGAGGTNTTGIGARAVVTLPDGTELLRETFGGHGTTSQDSMWLHFGVGNAQTVNLSVTFPASGSHFTFDNVATGQRVIVHEDGSTTTGL